LDLEELTLRYYLSLSSFLVILIYFIYLLSINSINNQTKIIEINKGDSINQISKNIFLEKNYFESKIYNLVTLIYDKYYKPINFGKFKIKKNSNIFELLSIISKKSNIDYKITIIEGWEKYQLREYISSFYNDYKFIDYNQLIADTYIINSSQSFNDFKIFLFNNLNNFFKEYENNKLIQEYGINNILIISSLVEKEAKDNEDKGLITSVIFNRLSKRMKLQIDATVISSITNGEYKLNRKLTYEDLKINHPINTYNIYGLPDKMISYVGADTIKIVLENPKSDFLFYFYNILEDKHIFSKNFNEHKTKLNEYRQKIK
tara:strand:- start:559 stop:1512 length:954 start_codon:yes stop_codon:yes gene_type:complete